MFSCCYIARVARKIAEIINRGLRVSAPLTLSTGTVVDSEMEPRVSEHSLGSRDSDEEEVVELGNTELEVVELGTAELDVVELDVVELEVELVVELDVVELEVELDVVELEVEEVEVVTFDV